MFLNVLTAADADQTAAPKASFRVAEQGRIEVVVDGARTTLAVPDWFEG
jgi:hypothetical protein